METEINEKTITEWAKQNKDRAKALGLRLIKNRAKPEELDKLQSLGDFEDQATAWAMMNPLKARALIIRLIKLVA